MIPYGVRWIHPFQWITDLDEKIPIRIFVEKQLRQLGIDLHHRDLTGHLYPSVLAVAMNNLSRLELAGLLLASACVRTGKAISASVSVGEFSSRSGYNPAASRSAREKLVATAVEPHSNVFQAHGDDIRDPAPLGQAR